jgi:hypothetical protein
LVSFQAPFQRLRIDKRERRAGDDWHFRPAQDFQEPQCVRHFLVAPAIAADDRQPKHAHARIIEQHQG